MDVKIVFSDLDDTLLTTDKHLASETRRALRALGVRGIEFVPCSGRALSGISQDILGLEACHYAVCSNGAAVVKISDGQALHRSSLGFERTSRLYEMLKGFRITFDCFIDGVVYAQKDRFAYLDEIDLPPNTRYITKSTRTVIDRSIPEFLQRKQEEHGNLERLTMYYHDDQERDAILTAVELDPTLIWTSSVPHDIEVMDRNAGKDNGLKWLCGYLNIPITSSVAFGDGLNDANMLKAAGLGVAVANAVRETKRSADKVVATNDDLGVAQTLQELLKD